MSLKLCHTFSYFSLYHRQTGKGYLPPADFSRRTLPDVAVGCPQTLDTALDGRVLSLVVEMLAWNRLTQSKEQAFSLARKGSRMVDEHQKAEQKKGFLRDLSLFYFKLAKDPRSHYDKVMSLVGHMNALDDDSIIMAFELARYASVWRTNVGAFERTTFVMPDEKTIAWVRQMVITTTEWMKTEGLTYNGIFMHGFNAKINRGDVVITSQDTLWNIVVQDTPMTKVRTLRLLAQYILAKEWDSQRLPKLRKVGVVNPCRGEVLTMRIDEASDAYRQVWDILLG